MFTYVMVGVAVQAVTIIERAIRFPELYAEGHKEPEFWIVAVIGGIFNVLVWPLSIACEIYNIANGK